MDNRDCKITLTCLEQQEDDGDEIYVMVSYADGHVRRSPPDKKRFEMSTGDVQTLQGRDITSVAVHEADAVSADDLIGEVKFETGVDAEVVVSGKDARYSVKARWQ